jgi:hypothetical protein
LRHYADGISSKFISMPTDISRNIVEKYLIQFASLQRTIVHVQAMSDRQMVTAFFIEKQNNQQQGNGSGSVVASTGREAQEKLASPNK